MKPKFLLIAAAFLVPPSSTFAQNWVRLAITPSKTVFYYDADSIKLNENRNIISILTMADHRDDNTIKKDFTEVLFKVNCPNLNLSQIHIYKYNAGPKDEERNYINPYDRFFYTPKRGNIEEKILDVACAL